ncbi:putative ribosomal RNA small subunit methyltransferase A [Sulfuracidifex tepidarius]|uniref:Ribosomal RNA small subunit methyltransferase A n=2 Tax=Sulfuracidifex tepidarius TaxID=1294262 RepID=A0A510E403_9CREN|nr:16S ribosomal RNA methyltransferase A [Sulfuracidifex tepidarius]BBG24429.1 putative ribosomal RNA small subunit methyltransferase A [Sulfuracidifex tepidarius]BBG27187.1 putative ribosomal RNA small subunit methyltransferase A [Sulfuracidifex tepidarius]
MRKFTSYISNARPLLEVGCGDGRISRLINPDICLEIDERFIQDLKNNNLVIADARDVPVRRGEIVASLPYYISRDFLLEISSLEFQRAVMILQKDFADKLINYTNSISLISNYYFVIEEKEVIPPNAFTPAPRVYSVITVFTRVRKNDDEVTRILNCVGRFRNKTLRKASSLCNKTSTSELHVREFKPWQVEELLNLIR